MKFVVSSNTLLTRLQAVSKVIGGKPVQPILDNILLVATEGVLYATASDKETTMEARIELESLEEEGNNDTCQNIAGYFEGISRTTVDIRNQYGDQ